MNMLTNRPWSCDRRRVQGRSHEVDKSRSALTASGSGTKTTYTLDRAVADPNTVVNYHGRSPIHADHDPVGSTWN